MSQENVDLVKAFFSAYNARDADACDRLFDANAEVTTVSTKHVCPASTGDVESESVLRGTR